jgi:hypothetical protein
MDGNMPSAQQGISGGRGGFSPGRQMPQPAQVAQAPADSTATPADIAGSWNYTVEGGQQSTGGVMVFEKNENGQWQGTIKSERMPQPVNLSSVAVTGNRVTYSYTLTFGGNQITIRVDATVTGDTMEGTMAFGDFRTVPIKAVRKKE